VRKTEKYKGKEKKPESYGPLENFKKNPEFRPI
jgi:hypothetical protein